MLKRKLLRDLWQNRTQFISIFLMAFLGLFVFAGIDAESTGIGISTAQYYEETNLADNWVMGTSFSTEEVKRLEALPIRSCYGVSQAAPGHIPLSIWMDMMPMASVTITG